MAMLWSALAAGSAAVYKAYDKYAHLTEASTQDITQAITKLKALQRNLNTESALANIEEAIGSLKPLLDCHANTWTGKTIGNSSVKQLNTLHEALKNYSIAPHQTQLNSLEKQVGAALKLLQGEESAKRGIIAGRVKEITGSILSSPASSSPSLHRRPPVHPLQALMHQIAQSRPGNYQLPEEAEVRLWSLLREIEAYDPIFEGLVSFVAEKMTSEVPAGPLQSTTPASPPSSSSSATSPAVQSDSFEEDDNGIGVLRGLRSPSMRSPQRGDLYRSPRRAAPVLPAEGDVLVNPPPQASPAKKLARLSENLDKLKETVTAFLVSQVKNEFNKGGTEKPLNAFIYDKLPLNAGASNKTERQKADWICNYCLYTMPDVTKNLWPYFIEYSQKRAGEKLLQEIRQKRCDSADQLVNNLSLAIELFRRVSDRSRIQPIYSETIPAWITTASKWVVQIHDATAKKNIEEKLKSYVSQIKNGTNLVETLELLITLFEEDPQLKPLWLEDPSPKREIESLLTRVIKETPQITGSVETRCDREIGDKVSELTRNLPLYTLFHFFYIFLGKPDVEEARKAYANIMAKVKTKPEDAYKIFKTELIDQLSKSNTIPSWRRYPLLAFLHVDHILPRLLPGLFVAALIRGYNRGLSVSDLPSFFRRHPLLLLAGLSTFYTPPLIVDGMHTAIESLTTPFIKGFFGYAHRKISLLTTTEALTPVDITIRGASSMLRAYENYSKGQTGSLNLNSTDHRKAPLKILAFDPTYYQDTYTTSTLDLDKAIGKQAILDFINPYPITMKIEQLRASILGFGNKHITLLPIAALSSFLLYLVNNLMSVIETPLVFLFKRGLLIPLLSHLEKVSSAMEGGINILYGPKDIAQVDAFIIELLEDLLRKIQEENGKKSQSAQTSLADIGKFRDLLQNLFELIDVRGRNSKQEIGVHFATKETERVPRHQLTQLLAPFASGAYQQILNKTFLDNTFNQLLTLATGLLDPKTTTLPTTELVNHLLEGKPEQSLNDEEIQKLLPEIIRQQSKEINRLLDEIASAISEKTASHLGKGISLTAEKAVSEFVDSVEERLFSRPGEKGRSSNNIFHKVFATLEHLEKSLSPSKPLSAAEQNNIKRIFSSLHEQFISILAELQEKQAQVDRFPSSETREMSRISKELVAHLRGLYSQMKELYPIGLSSNMQEPVPITAELARALGDEDTIALTRAMSGSAEDLVSSAGRSIAAIKDRCLGLERTVLRYKTRLEELRHVILQKGEAGEHTLEQGAAHVGKALVGKLREPIVAMGKDVLKEQVKEKGRQITELARDGGVTTHVIRLICTYWLQQRGTIKA